MSSENLSQEDVQQERQLTLPESKLPSNANLPQHDALFRAFYIWLIQKNILGRIALTDQAALALICSSLRTSLQGVADLHTLRPHFAPSVVISLLSSMAHNWPDYYVCEHCLHLHHHSSDVPGHAQDVAVVEQVSQHGKWVGVDSKTFQSTPLWLAGPHPALARRCQRYPRRPFLESFSSSYEGAPIAAVDKIAAGYMKHDFHTFAGALSPVTKRTPLAGLAHRHVQLILKRVRMVRKARARATPSALESQVQAALQPFAAELLLEPSKGNKPTKKYQFEPRVVFSGLDNTDPGEPRLLLKTVITLPYFEFTTTALSICPHQLANHWHWHDWGEKRFKAFWQLWLHQFFSSFVDNPYAHVAPAATEKEYMVVEYHPTVHGVSLLLPEFRLAGAAMCLVHLNSDPIWSNTDTDTEIDTDTVLTGSCHRCPTDFALRVVYGKKKIVEISVWQDFGP